MLCYVILASGNIVCYICGKFEDLPGKKSCRPPFFRESMPQDYDRKAEIRVRDWSSSEVRNEVNVKARSVTVSNSFKTNDEAPSTTRVRDVDQLVPLFSAFPGRSFISNIEAEYARIATKYLRQHAGPCSVLRSGCLFSSNWNINADVRGADVIDGGSSARAPQVERAVSSTQFLAPAVPFGHIGGSSRRGYTLAEKTFELLRDECLRSDKLYEDPDFPAIDRSVFHTQRFKRHFEWKRPPQFHRDPKLFVNGRKRFDLVQGELGDCWLVAAAADLTLNTALLDRVIPMDQGFSKAEKYCGIFHFQFWRHGQWIDVVIDDRLPTINGTLMFMHSAENSEFWSALLEKAYAKVNGSYENLKGGTTSEALEDFTGGLSELYELGKAPLNLFARMEKSFELGAMMACSIEASEAQLEFKMPNGLVMGHAYSITHVRMIDVVTPNKSVKVPCVRLRNPWGASEWKGPFSDGSKEWKFVPDSEKRQLELEFGEDGEFWMSYPDMLANFSKLEMCNLGPETMVSADPDFVKRHTVTWESNVFSGSWTRGVTAGGCRNFLDTFHLNPQYRITMRKTDGPDGLATCIIALMQKDRRKLRAQGLDFLTIGFAVYHLPDPRKVPTPLNKEFFRYNMSVGRSPAFVNSRQVTTRFRLPPGDYCIVPSTFEPNEEADFLVRVYSEIPIEMAEHDNTPAEVISSTPQDIRPPPMTLRQEEEVTALFNKIAGTDLEIDTNPLAIILTKSLKTHFPFKGFSPEIVRSMMTMSDVDFSGKLGLEEFTALWGTIKQWKDTFAKYDKKNAGKIEMQHLREAIESAGYLVNHHVLRVIALRYGQPDQTINFEDFILCIVRLQRMISIFRSKDTYNLKSAIFSFDDWMLNTMYT